MIPIDLVFVRHGQSEGNVAEDYENSPEYNQFFHNRHNAFLRLTDKGICQAQQAGVWLKTNIPTAFDRFYVSEYIRALETAAHLRLPHANWQRDLTLREREYGHFDRLSDGERENQFPRDWHKNNSTVFFGSLQEENQLQICSYVSIDF